MNTTLPSSEQDSISALGIYPQALLDRIIGLSKQAAENLILDLFDAGAVAADIAEDWLTGLDHLNLNA